MITFRFYLVTLVAIFLAVALGVVIGSTFLEPALVQDLNNRLDSVRGSLDERVARIDDLSDDIDDLEQYVEGSAPFAVEGSLDGAVVLVAANEGVDAGPVERLVSRLRQAGATTEGIVWLQPSMGSGDEVAAIADSLELDLPLDDPSAARAAVWDAVVRHTVDAVAPTVEGGPDTTASTTVPDTAPTSETTVGGDTTVPPETTPPPTDPTLPVPELFESDPLQLLDDVGWIGLQQIEVAEPVAVRPVPTGPPPVTVVLVTGTDADEGVPSIVDLARAQVAAGVPTVVAEVWAESDEDGAPARGAWVRPVREDAELAARVTTIDDLDLVQGQVATALAIRDLGAGIVGHYGYGDGAEQVLPPWLGP